MSVFQHRGQEGAGSEREEGGSRAEGQCSGFLFCSHQMYLPVSVGHHVCEFTDGMNIDTGMCSAFR